MEFFIAGLLVLNLAVTLVSVHLLKRETERVFRGVGQLLGEAKASLTGVNASQAELMHKLVRMDEQRKKDMETLLTEQGTTAGAFRIVFEKMNEMPSRQDLTEAFKQLSDSPAVLSREQEGAMSKAMEEGISSILGYTAGKVPGVELRL